MNKHIEKIKSNSVLSDFLSNDCSENNVSTTFDHSIKSDDFVIIKVDDYYNSLSLVDTPPSPDCLIILKCIRSGYSLSIIELKSISNSKGFTVDNMIKKFETCLYDFIEKRFSDLLLIDYKRIRLYFVSDIELYRRDIGLKMELLIHTRFMFNNKTIMITPYKPVPTIKNCY